MTTKDLPALAESDDSDFDAHATLVADSDSDSDSDDMDIDAEGAQREFDEGRGTNELRDERSKRRRFGMLRKVRIRGAIGAGADELLSETPPQLLQVCNKDVLKAMVEAMDAKA